jgi:hypothetical protein
VAHWAWPDSGEVEAGRLAGVLLEVWVQVGEIFAAEIAFVSKNMLVKGLQEWSCRTGPLRVGRSLRDFLSCCGEKGLCDPPVGRHGVHTKPTE